MERPSEITERFSLAEFEARGRDSAEAEQLARDLRVAIGAELREPTRNLAQKIAERLNALGHHCREDTVELLDDGHVAVTFVDDSHGADTHRLRFNLDLVISSGFPGYTQGD